MLVKINFTALIVAILGTGLFLGTIFGKIQQVINFADPLNEMGFALLGLIIGMMGLFGSIERVKQSK